MSETAVHPRGELIASFRGGFKDGLTSITTEGGPGLDVGIDFGIHRMAAGRELKESHPKETVWVLLKGRAELSFAGSLKTVQRDSIFDEAPTALHLGPRTEVAIKSIADCEWAVARAHNGRNFAPRIFLPEDLKPEYRGRGLAQDACLRNVRLIFDKTVRAEANLVIGEVINYPGRWSSYPPHHHAQPEIYHYRFTEPQGYGHGEAGEEVFKLRHNDTLKLPGGLDHAQVAAPGYGMYYLWVVRHLKGNPYTGFEFAKEHAWLLDPKRQGWQPREES